MANRLTKITTRTGDDGSTGLGDGTRIRKSANRVQILGDIDELNSALGVLLCESLDESTRVSLTSIQNSLFDLGGECCIPGSMVIGDDLSIFLEQLTREINAGLPPLKEFILPGGSRAAALCHVARTVARRAERSLVALGEQETINAASLRAINRMSDYLFVLARHLNKLAGQRDVLWRRDVQHPASAV